MKLASLDITLFVIYVVALIGIAWWVSREKQGHQKDTNDYFLAGSSLPWWAIGASLIGCLPPPHRRTHCLESWFSPVGTIFINHSFHCRMVDEQLPVGQSP